MESRKIPWKLSPTRKANARARLKKVDSVIEALRASGVKCAALVSKVIYCPFRMTLRILLCRTERLSYQRSTKCLRGTSTQCSVHRPGVTEKVYIRFRNGRGYVFCTVLRNVH